MNRVALLEHRMRSGAGVPLPSTASTWKKLGAHVVIAGSANLKEEIGWKLQPQKSNLAKND
jgi:hypothetical protein